MDKSKLVIADQLKDGKVVRKAQLTSRDFAERTNSTKSNKSFTIDESATAEYYNGYDGKEQGKQEKAFKDVSDLQEKAKKKSAPVKEPKKEYKKSKSK